MGLFLSRLGEILESFSSDDPVSAVMLGLDAAGKTTVLYKLKFNESVSTIPTIGFNVETVQPCKGLTMTIWDVGGQDNIRPLWRHYYDSADGLIFVVDSCDVERIAEAKEELHQVVKFDNMRHVPVLVFANKQDLPHAMDVGKVADKLDLQLLGRWHVQACCAISGEGLLEGFERFSAMVKEYRKSVSRPR